MANTPVIQYPYSVLTDTPDIPRDVKALADAAEARGGRGTRVASGTGTTLAGTNNFDASSSIVVAAKAWPQIVMINAYLVTTMTGAGASSPALRVLDASVTERARIPLMSTPNSGGVGSLSDIYLLSASTSISLKMNVDIPAGWSVTSYTGIGSFSVVAIPFLAATSA